MMPKQPALPFPSDPHVRSQVTKSKSQSHEAANREAAALVLADPARYGAGLVEWARRVKAAQTAQAT